jgi:hypothetical protein
MPYVACLGHLLQHTEAYKSWTILGKQYGSHLASCWSQACSVPVCSAAGPAQGDTDAYLEGGAEAMTTSQLTPAMNASMMKNALAWQLLWQLGWRLLSRLLAAVRAGHASDALARARPR